MRNGLVLYVGVFRTAVHEVVLRERDAFLKFFFDGSPKCILRYYNGKIALIKPRRLLYRNWKHDALNFYSTLLDDILLLTLPVYCTF